MNIPLLVSLSALLIVASLLGIWLLWQRCGLDPMNRRVVLVLCAQSLILSNCLAAGVCTLFYLWSNGWF